MGIEQAVLEESVPACGRGIGTRGSSKLLSILTILGVYEFKKWIYKRLKFRGIGK